MRDTANLLNDDIHQTLIDDELAQTFLPARPKDSHKGTCGKILIVASSRGMTGAASLAAMSAMIASLNLLVSALKIYAHRRKIYIVKRFYKKIFKATRIVE